MRKHENQATSKTQPWLRARPIRQCETCGRDLPRRAFRRQCAGCIKHWHKHGYDKAAA